MHSPEPYLQSGLLPGQHTLARALKMKSTRQSHTRNPRSLVQTPDSTWRKCAM